jgi:hypothetical protein
VKDIDSMRASLELRFLLPLVGVLVVVVSPVAGQLPDQEKVGIAASGSGSVKYQISATLTDYCPVERTLNLHQVMFDFHNKSCRAGSKVAERKTPTLPNGPLYRNVHIAGYHLIDWSEGHPSPNTRNTAKVEFSKTATTLSASGWLGKATCTKKPAGDVQAKDVLAEDTFWQARVVPEVQLTEDLQQQEPAVTEDLVPPQTTALLKLPAACDSDRPQSLEFTVTPLVNGVAQASIYTGELKAGEKANKGELDVASIHALWSASQTKGASELRVSVVDRKGVKEPSN